MKKLLLFILTVTICQLSFSQSINDKDTYVEMTNTDGESIAIGKSQVESLKISGSRVYVMTSRQWGNDDVSRILRFRPADYGFSSTSTFYNHLSAIFFRSYKITYSYDSGLVDTVSYYAGDSLAFRTVYTYSGSVVSEKSAPINQ